MQVSQIAQRFQLQYFFPNSSVGETGRTGFASRREIGHGHLAERSLAPVVPSMVRLCIWWHAYSSSQQMFVTGVHVT